MQNATTTMSLRSIDSQQKQFHLDIQEPVIKFPFGAQPTISQMSKMRKSRRYYFISLILEDKKAMPMQHLAQQIGDALPCRRYILIKGPELSAQPGSNVFHALIDLNPPIFCIEALERMYLEKGEKTFLNINPGG